MEANHALRALRTGKGARGFTLIELVIVLLIIGILAAIAIPSYNSYIAKAARNDAKSAMLELAQVEERFYSNQVPPVYIAMAAPPTVTTTTMGPAWVNWAGGDSIGSRKYSISISLDPASMTDATTAGSKQSYLIEAIPVSASQDPDCGTLRLFSNGIKIATGPKGSACW